MKMRNLCLMRDQCQEIKRLLEKNVDVNFKNKFEQTSLSKVTEEDSPALVKLLLDHNVNVNVKNRSRRIIFF